MKDLRTMHGLTLSCSNWSQFSLDLRDPDAKSPSLHAPEFNTISVSKERFQPPKVFVQDTLASRVATDLEDIEAAPEFAFDYGWRARVSKLLFRL